ncbi:tetratricopeptide repeat protein [Duganella qianjiadongensis]|uniref:Tetratricopeptide repeat protein n=1 Tax=Duganella qianjiadongensis TaxID=2692176 RepID=A0ABW9VQB7_9BURK|nr:tetratricopeptide repeat protein [Duganella qianjiadongensis]MYM39902.1 tetratricopeptide repeat protein [Duganella qianjiadongensis]
MSLINKMLQDLDARGGSADGGLRQQQLHAVEMHGGGSSKLRMAALALGVALLAGGGGYGWHYWQGQRVAHAVDVAATGAARAAPEAVVSQPKATVAAVAAAPDSAQPVAAATPSAPAAIAAPAASAPVAAPVAAPAPGAAPPAPAPVAVVSAAQPEKKARAAQAPRQREGASTARSNDETGEAGTITHNLSPKLMAENTYRRGLVALQEGRVHAALTDFERALDIDPRNEAARQTYISLLLENKRNDDAVRQLRLALGLDPRQPGLAMILARLQLEKGGPALQTLLTTMPYAGSNPEYHAFLAGVLQREQRHAEAAQHYRDALQLAPQNGVWWMGLGISLQADNHLTEAREAFRRARAASGLSAELQTFIDRKLDALSR